LGGRVKGAGKEEGQNKYSRWTKIQFYVLKIVVLKIINGNSTYVIVYKYLISVRASPCPYSFRAPTQVAMPLLPCHCPIEIKHKLNKIQLDAT